MGEREPLEKRLEKRLEKIRAEDREARRFDWKALLGALLIVGAAFGGGILIVKVFILTDDRVQVDRADCRDGLPPHVQERTAGMSLSEFMETER